MKLSIITVNLNNLAGLKKTMQSVFGKPSPIMNLTAALILDGNK